ncbi:epoxide hydrolase [Diaminobutyricibacter tongyongensis]|uniref:Epoxide hydrolase n=1 Tax=Leifsonia tongyongensis TaxID=1268043 RepID=A0A6L9Y0L0_9MICO|nr:epoxide hydrolase family protein [Diaminobutyricibacter tongyongensis]NEN07191.1 epoxide hydrolase [Diaminobutyricibacter tongyongensis]
MTIEPFRIRVPDEVLDDLRLRLERTRLVPALGSKPWEGGMDPARLRAMVAAWAAFDWRAIEDRLNAFEHSLADVRGHRIHFVRIPAAGSAELRVPLLLLHGWPSAFTEYLPLGERLANPAASGSDARIAFDVIIPSLPGFVFSELGDRPLTRHEIAEDLHELMTGVLGYDRYAAFGGDIGGGAATWLGVEHADRVIGIQLLNAPFPADTAPHSEEERVYLEGVDRYDRADGGYSEIMLTRPDTIAAALGDSPAGLLAWIADKWHDWVDGDLDRVVDADVLLTIATLYWVTESIGTSFAQYFDYPANAPRPLIEAPVGVYLCREPVMQGFPRSLAERASADLREFVVAPRGGHFAGIEQPEDTADAIRAFFTRMLG